MDHIARIAGLVLAAIPVLVLVYIYMRLSAGRGEYIRGDLQIFAGVIFGLVQYLVLAMFFMFRRHPAGYWMLLIYLLLATMITGLVLAFLMSYLDLWMVIGYAVYLLLCLIEMPMLVIAMLNTYAARRKAAGEATAGIPESGKPATVDNTGQERI